MSIDPKIFVSCPKHSQPMSHICVDKDCQLRTIICNNCRLEQHSGHAICRIKDFYDYATHLSHDATLEMEFERFSQSLNSAKGTLVKHIDEARKRLNELEVAVLSSVDEIQAVISKEVELYASGKKSAYVYKPDQSIAAFQEDMTSQVARLLSSRNCKKSLIFKMETLPRRLSQVDREIYNFYRQTDAAIGLLWKKVLRSLRQAPYQQTPAPEMLVARFPNSRVQLNRWSQTSKHKDIEFSTNNVIYRQAQTTPQEVHCLMEDDLREDRVKGRTFYWAFRIGDIKGSMLVGICNDRLAANCGYQLHDASIDHGFYLVSSKGKLYHSDNPAENGNTISFQFKKDDMLGLEYNPRRNELIVTKNKGEESTTIRGIKQPQSGALRGVVFLNGTHDCIRLKQYI